jgi:hypothetical protein
MDRDGRGGGPRISPLCGCPALAGPHDPGACAGLNDLADDLADALGL